MKHRENEDDLVCLPELHLYAVADGMSGTSGGKVASDLAVRAIAEYITMAAEEGAEISSTDLLREAILAANFTIFQTSLRRPEYIGMGTTLTAALIDDGDVTIGHVGDSRCYHAHGAEVKQLTQDHILDKEVEPGSARRILSQCVGFEETVMVETFRCHAQPGDMFVLCTDGISDVLDESDLRRIIEKSSHGDNPCDKVGRELVKLAKLRGSKDDTTAVIIKVH